MPTDTAEPGPRGGVLRPDHSPEAVGRVASLGLTTPQDVFGLRRSAQQAAAAGRVWTSRTRSGWPPR